MTPQDPDDDDCSQEEEEEEEEGNDEQRQLQAEIERWQDRHRAIQARRVEVRRLQRQYDDCLARMQVFGGGGGGGGGGATSTVVDDSPQQQQQQLESSSSSSSLLSPHELLKDFLSASRSVRRQQAWLGLLRTWGDVWTDCFPIAHRGPFGTINGLRLGYQALKQQQQHDINGSFSHMSISSSKKHQQQQQQENSSNHNHTVKPFSLLSPTPPPLSLLNEPSSSSPNNNNNNNETIMMIRVPWIEINAALGHVALLLATVNEQIDHVQLRHKIYPCGSTSTIAVVSSSSSGAGADYGTVYPLYYSEDVAGGVMDLIFSTRKRNFHHALKGLLDCVTDVALGRERMRSSSSSSSSGALLLPHPIQGDTIGGLSVVFEENEGLQWTRAMKYLLTDLKHLLADQGFHVGGAK